MLGSCLVACPALADLGSPSPPCFLPLSSGRGTDALLGILPLSAAEEFGGVGSSRPPGLAQRAIDDEEPEKKKKPLPGEEQPPLEPQSMKEEAEDLEPKSPTKALLMSAALPGLGELYVGSPRGFIFMGVEAATWITYAAYHSSSNDKEDEMFSFADQHFSMGAFEADCVGQPGQPCSEAINQIRNFYENDRAEYYEIISKNPIYKPGWGVDVQGTSYTYENGPRPTPEGTDEFRRWVADQAQAQDSHYASYNETRDDRNSLDKTARGMTMVALVNHLASAWDAFALAKGFNAQLPAETEMKFKINGSFNNPGAKLVFRRRF
jgi:hypothetical protein